MYILLCEYFLAIPVAPDIALVLPYPSGDVISDLPVLSSNRTSLVASHSRPHLPAAIVCSSSRGGFLLSLPDTSS